MVNEGRKTGKNFIIVSMTIFISKVLGFARDIVIASTFGTSLLTDAFQVVFGFPSLLFTSIGTALSSVNIPDLTYYVNQRSYEERNQYIFNLLAQVTIACTLVSVVGILLAPALTHLWGLDNSVYGVTLTLTRIMMPTLLFVSLTFIATGILQVHEHFLLAAAISIPFNLLIIAALIIKRADIVFLGYVTTAGWLLQFLIQVPMLRREKYRLTWKVNFGDEHTLAIFRQLLPILLGNSLLQLCLIIDRSFATHLSEGTTAALAFGSTLFVTITSIFIVAMSSVVFPRLSAYCLELDYPEIRSLLGYIFRTLIFILLPYLILVTTYSREIISLLYERGAFTAESTTMTALAFLLYSLAVPGYACQEIFNRLYYALKNFKVPMTVSLFCLLLKLLLDLVLYKAAGITGISLSTAFCLLLYGVIMGFMIWKDIGALPVRELAVFTLRLLLPMAGMLAVIIAFHFLPGNSSRLFFLLPLCGSGIVYLALAWITGLIPKNS